MIILSIVAWILLGWLGVVLWNIVTYRLNILQCQMTNGFSIFIALLLGAFSLVILSILLIIMILLDILDKLEASEIIERIYRIMFQIKEK